MISNGNGIMRKTMAFMNYKKMSLKIEINKDKLENLENITGTHTHTQKQKWLDLNDKKYEKKMKSNSSVLTKHQSVEKT